MKVNMIQLSLSPATTEALKQLLSGTRGGCVQLDAGPDTASFLTCYPDNGGAIVTFTAVEYNRRMENV